MSQFENTEIAKTPSTLTEIADAQVYTLERLAYLEEQLSKVLVHQLADAKSGEPTLIGGTHVHNIAATQHEINARVNNIISSLVL